MSTPEIDLHARIAALEKLSGADQLHVKAAQSEIDCAFVTSHDIRKLVPTKAD